MKEQNSEIVYEEIDLIKEFNVSDIKFNAAYQRTINPKKVRTIRNSIKKYGMFWGGEVIVLNEQMEVIDGQHRVMAATESNILKLPVLVVTFGSKKEEAGYFVDKNMHTTKLTPVDFWHASYISGCTIAKTIYALNNDPKSLLHNKIAIKGGNNDKTRFSIPTALCFLNVVCLDGGRSVGKSKHERIKTHIAKYSYDEILLKMNIYVQWFNDCFGDSKVENPKPYGARVASAIAALYIIMYKSGKIRNTRAYNNSVTKMRKYRFSEQTEAMTIEGITMAMVIHLNKGVHKNNVKLPYSLDQLRAEQEARVATNTARYKVTRKSG